MSVFNINLCLCFLFIAHFDYALRDIFMLYRELFLARPSETETCSCWFRGDDFHQTLQLSVLKFTAQEQHRQIDRHTDRQCNAARYAIGRPLLGPCYAPPAHRVGALSVYGRRLTVCLSVQCLTLSREWKEEGRMKIGRKEAHDTDDQWPHFKTERSKVKITRPLNAVTENQPYLRKHEGLRTSKLVYTRMEYGDPHHRHARWPQRSKVTVIMSRRPFESCLFIIRQRKVAETPKIGRKVVRAMADIPHQFKGQRSRSLGRSGWLFNSLLQGTGYILHYMPHSFCYNNFGIALLFLCPRLLVVL